MIALIDYLIKERWKKEMEEAVQAKFEEKIKELVSSSKKSGYADYNKVLETFAS